MNALAPSGYAVLITAAGRGQRAGTERPKQWCDLGGKPVLTHAIEAFAGFGRIVLIVHRDDMGEAISRYAGPVTIIAGGETRSASVFAGLHALEGQASHVLIHDGARPLCPAHVIQGVIEALQGGATAAAPALPVADTLWQGDDSHVTGILPREGLYRAQTPQGFRLPEILAAHRAHPEGATDDVAIALQMGHKVAITPGSEDNLKITFPDDFARAEKLLR